MDKIHNNSVKLLNIDVLNLSLKVGLEQSKTLKGAIIAIARSKPPPIASI